MALAGAEAEICYVMLEDALQAAEETNQAKRRFLSNMSHDIRTPMNAIMGMTLLDAADLDPQRLILLRRLRTDDYRDIMDQVRQ